VIPDYHNLLDVGVAYGYSLAQEGKVAIAITRFDHEALLEDIPKRALDYSVG
jgi:hypothetical protein